MMESVPLYKLLGMSLEDLDRLSIKFSDAVAASGRLSDLCEWVVDEYGAESVYMAMNVYIMASGLDPEPVVRRCDNKK